MWNYGRGAVTALVVLLSNPAMADDRRVFIVNATSHTMMRFYAARAATEAFDVDRLAAEAVRPGGRVRVDIDDGSGACRYDFKAVFDDGDQLVRRNINVCEIAEFSYVE